MVLEQIIPFERLEKNPWLILFISFIFVSFAVLLTRYFYPNDRGVVVILLTIMPAIPFFLNFIRVEEKKHELSSSKKHSLFTIYRPLIMLYAFFFIGTALSFALWSSALPADLSDYMFSDIKDEFNRLQNAYVPAMHQPTSAFDFILNKNLLVLALMILFSFIYSIGAIFLLTWNAAMLGVFIEVHVRAYFISLSQQFGLFAYPIAFVMGSVEGLLSILPHGIFELSAFFLAALGGGILSVAFERGTYRHRAFWCIVLDSMKLFLLAVVLLVAGALIESLYA